MVWQSFKNKKKRILRDLLIATEKDVLPVKANVDQVSQLDHDVIQDLLVERGNIEQRTKDVQDKCDMLRNFGSQWCLAECLSMTSPRVTPAAFSVHYCNEVKNEGECVPYGEMHGTPNTLRSYWIPWCGVWVGR